MPSRSSLSHLVPQTLSLFHVSQSLSHYANRDGAEANQGRKPFFTAWGLWSCLFNPVFLYWILPWPVSFHYAIASEAKRIEEKLIYFLYWLVVN